MEHLPKTRTNNNKIKNYFIQKIAESKIKKLSEKISTTHYSKIEEIAKISENICNEFKEEEHQIIIGIICAYIYDCLEFDDEQNNAIELTKKIISEAQDKKPWQI